MSYIPVLVLHVLEQSINTKKKTVPHHYVWCYFWKDVATSYTPRQNYFRVQYIFLYQQKSKYLYVLFKKNVTFERPYTGLQETR